MVPASDIASRCAASTFTVLTLLGAEFLSIEANVVPNYSFDVPHGWTYSQPALNVQNVTLCNVTITYTHPGQNDTIHAEAWLPSEDNYNGRLQSLGGSAWTPGRYILTYAGMINAVANGYASITTDAGIPETASPADWLLTTPGNINSNALQNFGQVSLDDELIKSFYGKAPSYSYWNGCSQGGRQGLKLAQQYPNAYDGIIAAAPAINWAEFYITSVWPVFYMESTQQFPYDCELNAITSLAVSACDVLDGVKDGIISDVEACRREFNPFKHIGKSFDCSTTNSKHKISHAAAAVANASWAGPRFSNGKSMYAGYEIGSDLSTLAPTNCTGKVCRSGAEGSVEFAWRTFVKKDVTAVLNNATHRDFDTIFRHVKQIFASNFETNEIDLRDFRDAGGKMITYHGLADPSISPGGTLHYYNEVSNFVGNVTSFYKYYQVPALEHCWGGNGGQPEALFDQLRAWVEDDIEPTSTPVVVTKSDNTTQQQILCPYPQKARFSTSCNAKNSTSCWSCAN
ncbi:glycoside hydrolase [Fusarium longipes]|uniref:Carboxylic ester hydrolase n=1 Tax=Fusarium longipes TaxID=694270 RepID=A0A395SI03_9HYPO|nr:glycoside hydrolase [Fusarium longipes]